MKAAVILLLPLVFLTLHPVHPVLRIDISNVRNRNGVILLSVYSSPQEYPYHPFRTYEVKKDSLKQGNLSTVITDLNSGTYGMCLLDDENRSGGMEYNFIGIPLEGYGFANNVRPLIKHPDYDRCLFTLRDGDNRLELIVRYKN
jgi:uncharacterized protein (DUF2141 family)